MRVCVWVCVLVEYVRDSDILSILFQLYFPSITGSSHELVMNVFREGLFSDTLFVDVLHFHEDVITERVDSL